MSNDAVVSETNGLSSKGHIRRISDFLSCTEIGFPEEIMTADVTPVHPLTMNGLTYKAGYPVWGIKRVIASKTMDALQGFRDHASCVHKECMKCNKMCLNCELSTVKVTLGEILQCFTVTFVTVVESLVVKEGAWYHKPSHTLKHSALDTLWVYE